MTLPGLRARFSLWTAAMAALTLYYFAVVQPHLAVETDILAMLPQVDRDPVVEDAVRKLADVTGKRTLFLVGAPTDDARAAATDFAQALRDSGAFASVLLDVTQATGDIDRLYGPHRALLLSQRDHARLAAGQGAALAQDALHALYTPAGWGRAQPFADDPLNLYGDFLFALLPGVGHLSLQDGMLAADRDGRRYVMVTAQTLGSPFALATQGRAAPAIDAAKGALAQKHKDTEVIASGILRHAAANAERAQTEISAFGSVSLVAVVLLILVTFRSLRPLALALLSIGAGALAGIVACDAFFERVHIITLVFGSTLVGVGVDYSIHYFADQFRHQGTWPPESTLHHVGPAILIGMLATALGYQALLLPPFPGLRQMAVFSVAGVVASCLSVLLWFPLLANRKPAAHVPAALRIARALESIHIQLRPSPRLIAAALALLAFTAFGLSRLTFQDDIRALQSSPPELRAEEARVRDIVGTASETRFFLVEGPTAQAALQAEEALRARLDALVQRGALSGYRAISAALPSLARQNENRALLEKQVYAPDGALDQLLRAVGAGAATAQRQREAFASATPLTPEEWLASPASEALRGLWLGATERGFATAVSLEGVADLAALRAAGDAAGSARLIDRVAQISEVMQRYRRIATLCLIGAYAAIGLALMLRYGAATGLRLLAAPVGAAALSLAVLGLCGVPANLFNLLALLLVLGMGVDYSVFMREGQDSRATVIMAIMLAGVMTLLSFGMLALSATPFIRGLGLTVLLGVTLTFALALVCSAPTAGDKIATSSRDLPTPEK